MSDRPIQVGDLVVVVRSSNCIGGNDGVGHVFVVLRIKFGAGLHCHYCGKNHGFDENYAEDMDYWWPLRRLRRIPPLSDLESEQRKEELPA
jgi:hypothetical protein